jgi:uncharacterized protein DUF955
MGLARRRQWESAAARRVVAASGHARTLGEAIVSVASRLLDGIACPPTDLEALGARLNVSAFRPSDLPVAGELRKNSTNFEVVYASGMKTGRRRFTIAHELGHAFFEQTGPGCPRSGEELEAICDMLAAEFLMPKPRVELQLSDRPTAQEILDMAKEFEVSIEAAARRCCKLRGLQAFGVNASGTLLFTTGLVRSANEDISVLAKRVSGGESVRSGLYLASYGFATRLWQVEGTPIGNGRSGLFVLWPTASGGRDHQSATRDAQTFR